MVEDTRWTAGADPENPCPVSPVVDIVFSRWTTDGEQATKVIVACEASPRTASIQLRLPNELIRATPLRSIVRVSVAAS